MSLLIGASSPAQGASGAQGAAADLGETIDQSLRFTGAGRLVSADTKPSGDYTFAFWWKRGDDPQGSSLDSLLTFTPNGGYQCVEPQRGNNSGISVRDGATLRDITDGTLPDYTAWYHICIISESGTSRCYVNGVKQSNTGAEPTGGAVMCIGSNQIASQDDALVGYLAEFNLLDGTVVGDTNNILDEFGRVNNDGVWVPKEISFTSAQYGAKGFRLVFDSSADGGIGDDSAPTGTGHTAANDFTATGFDTTAISSSNEDNDIDYNDTPTSNHGTFNPLATSNTISDANLHSTASSYIFSPSTFAIPPNSGKFYWEVTMETVSGNQTLGACSPTVAPGQTPASNWVWTPNLEDIESDQGNVLNLVDTAVSTIGTAAGTTYMIAYDSDTQEFWVGDSGTFYKRDGAAGAGDPANGNNPFLTTSDACVVSGETYCPCTAGSSTGTTSYFLNVGQMDFVHTPPTGFNALQTNNLPEPTIKNGKEHFNILTWTGTGTTNALTGLGFQPDLVWVKKRTDTAESHDLQDVIRGAGERLRSDNVDRSSTVAGTITSFDSDGFTVVDAGTTNELNKTYVAWCWKAGGTAGSNGDGSTTSTVSANTVAGFSIVKYTGTSANATVGHGLSSPPECIIFKDYTDTNEENWVIWFNGFDVSTGEHLKFNTNGLDTLSTLLNGNAPTSSVIHLGNNTLINDNGEDVIAYCWHSVEGYSKFGSFEANNDNGNGPFVYLGFRPHYLLCKAADIGTENWVILDSTRSTSNVTADYLMANKNQTERDGSTFVIGVDFLANGFKCRGNNNINTGTGTYVFMAFAENPFGGVNAPPATAR